MSDNHPKGETVLDVTGLLCPLPVLKARKRLEAMASGAVLSVIATDPMSAIDMPHFCNEQGHVLLSQQQQGQSFHFRIKRK
ncbi:MAG: sulfurtransferase TusA family protein [Rhizobiales bacterium]|nr:sulfurtransferase TusA family protein [Hyphomicrobiales bacterium]